MIQYWLLFGFGSIALLLFVPIKILVNSNPEFRSEISWIFFKIKFVLVENNLSTSYYLFHYRFKKGKKPSENIKSTLRKDKKKKRKKITLTLIRDIANHSSIPKIIKKFIYLSRQVINSFSIKRLHWDISIDDFFFQGMLQSLISSFPQTRKIAIKGNFEEINAFSLKAHLSIIKILSTLLIFVVTFPYFDSLRLYKKIKTIT